MEREGERVIAMSVRCFRFLVIVMIRPNTHSIQFPVALSTMAQTFSLHRLDMNDNKQRRLYLWLLFFFQSLQVTRNIILTV